MFNKILIIAFALVIATVFTHANMAKAQIVTKGLVSSWSFDKASIKGETVKDLWGDNDGTINGNPEIVEGKYGDALSFDTREDYVDFGSDASFDITSAVTLEAWIKPQTLTSKYGMVVGKWNDGAGECSYFLGLRNDNTIRVDIYANAEFHGNHAGTIVDGEWTHIAMTYDGDNQKVYQDGVLVGTFDVDGNINVTPSVSVMVGTAVSRWNFRGIIDDVRIYNRALSRHEIFATTGLAIAGPTEKLAPTWGEIKVGSYGLKGETGYSSP